MENIFSRAMTPPSPVLFGAMDVRNNFFECSLFGQHDGMTLKLGYFLVHFGLGKVKIREYCCSSHKSSHLLVLDI